MLFSILFLALLSSHTQATALTLATNNTSTAESDIITQLLSNNPPNTIPTSNTPSSPNSSSISSSYLDTPIGPISCIRPGPSHHRVPRNDYLANLEQIMVLEDAMTVRPWQLGGTAVVRWTKGSCIIGVGTAVPSPLVGVFQPALVAHLAAGIAKICLTDQAGQRGGTLKFGEPMQLVAVLGARMEMLGAGAEF